MATPYVPVPMPIGNTASSFTDNRNQRSSSFGSASTSSNSSKGQLEDSNMGNFKQTSVPDQMENTSSVCSSSLIRTKFTGAASSTEYSTRGRETEEQNPETVNLEDRPSTPTILGYDVMEERAKFTVYEILVKKTPEESWVVFRRYTDFSRLNDKLKEMFPGFRLALPPKQDRQLGLQAFLQNLVAHKDIANCLAVGEFLYTNYRLQKELLDKQKEMESLKKLLDEKQLHIDTLEKIFRTMSLEPKESLDVSETEGEQILKVEFSALEVDHDVLEEESRTENKPCLSFSEPEYSVSEIEVAEVAYDAEED
uniref:PX domain-containing protein n=1 Tax=Cebus imitator TaxID=2715852 RepID=A0A2K5R4S3_CEBIM